MTALQSDHANKAAEYLLGRVYLETNRYGRALSCAAHLMTQGHHDEDVQLLFATALDKAGSHVQAGQYFLALNHLDEAIASFEEALVLNANDSEAKDGLVKARREKEHLMDKHQ